MEQEKAIILLSTYNGMEYIREQLDSLLAQDYPNLQIVIRDDGSSDETVSILREYSEQHANISYYTGKNVGVIESFFDLIKHIEGESFGYVFLCDQDDVWKKSKVRRAIYCIKKKQEQKETVEQDLSDAPLLYCGKPQLTDAELNPYAEEIKKTMRPDFANALVENIVTGCTVAMNKSMYDIALEYMPQYCIMHDWWLYLIATCFGHVIYDSKPYILYRQHGDNAMGLEHSRLNEVKSRAQKFRARKGNICRQAEELVRLLEEKNDFEDESALEDKVLECYKRAKLLAHYKEGGNRLSLVFQKKVFRQRFGDHIIYKLLFILGLR